MSSKTIDRLRAVFKAKGLDVSENTVRRKLSAIHKGVEDVERVEVKVYLFNALQEDGEFRLYSKIQTLTEEKKVLVDENAELKAKLARYERKFGEIDVVMTQKQKDERKKLLENWEAYLGVSPQALRTHQAISMDDPRHFVNWAWKMRPEECQVPLYITFLEMDFDDPLHPRFR